MKPSTFRNLIKLMLVNGLALFFGLITVSSTLATAQSNDVPPAPQLQQAVPQSRIETPALIASEPEQTAPLADVLPADVSPADRLPINSSSVITPEVTQLTANVLSQDWGDFDRDGYLDLALGTTSGISIYHNLAGQLILSNTLTPYPAYAVRWADLNDDGLLELVTAGSITGVNRIYRYTGSSFATYGTFTASVQLARVVVLNGSRDLVASTSVISTPCPVVQFRRNTSGNYPAPPVCVSTSASAGLSAGDFDKDGDSDLVVGSFPNNLKLLINTNGVLTDVNLITQTNAFVIDTTSTWPYDFAWGDYDGDNRLDLAVAFPLERQVRVYHNEGAGAPVPFQLSGMLPAHRFMTPLSIDWADFDGDGALDLAMADDPPQIVFNVNRSIHSTPEDFALANQATGDSNWSIRGAALENSDLSAVLSGKLDSTSLYALAGGHLQSEIVPLTAAVAANSVAWGDTNGDGRLELLLGAYAQANGTLYPNVNGVITTTNGADFAVGSRQSVALGKLDRTGDKLLSLVIGGTDSLGRGFFNVYMRANNPNLISQVKLTSGPVSALALGDFNSDGWLDLLVGTSTGANSGSIQVYRNNQVSFDSTPAYSVAVSGQVRSVAWADYDPPPVTTISQNRFLDFAVATSNQVIVYHNEGNNLFTPNVVASTLGNTAVAWGDFNNDGLLDLAVGGNNQGVRIFFRSGTTFNLGWTSGSVYPTTSLAAGDWNNDGRIDLAVGNNGAADVVFANLGETPGALNLVPTWSSQDADNTTALAWGDVNNDGYLDLAVSRSTGLSGVYYNTSVTPWHLATPPSFASVARPGKAFDAYLYSSSDFLPGSLSSVTTTLAPTVSIYYTVTNPVGTPITNTQLELSLDGGSSWQTPYFTRTLVPTQTSPTGQSGVMIWDAARSPVFSDNALFRIRVVDQSPVGPFQRAASMAVSPPFRVRTMSCQWLTGLWIDVQPSDHVQPLDTVTFNAKVSSYSGGTISYTWTIFDGAEQTYIDAGYSQIFYTYQNAGIFEVRLTAQNSGCSEGPPLQAVKYMYVGSTAVTYTLYLPLVQRGAAAVQTSRPDTIVTEQPRQASVATALGGATVCLPKTILPGTRPTVDWLAGTPGYHGQPALNQDGSRFAFWSTADLAGTNADGNIELYYAQVDRPGSCVTFTQITSSTGGILEGFNLGPTLNATGDRLAFFSDRDLTGDNGDQNFEIFFAQIQPAGNISVSQVTRSPRGVNALPSINAAGDRVAFVSDLNYRGSNADGNQEIFVTTTVPITGQASYTQVTQTPLGTFNDEPALSGSGQHIAFVRGGDQTGGLQEIFTGNTNQADSLITVTTSPIGIWNYRPTIGGDESQYLVAYAAANITGDIVSVATISGTSISSQPVFTTSHNSQPALNATNGSRLLVVSGTQRLAVLTPADESATPVYACASPNCMYSALSGDGMHVVFVSGKTLQESYYETATLALTLTQPNLAVVAGVPLTRTIVLQNDGPGAADGVILTTALQDGTAALVPITMTAKPGSICSGSGPVTCRIPGVGINSSTFITLWTTQAIDPAESGPLTLAANANAWQAVTTTITPSLTVNAESDLMIAKTLSTTAVAGELVTYTLTITNGGPSRARNVMVTDLLPDYLRPVALSSAAFQMTNTAQLITGTLNVLTPSVPVQIQIVAEISSTAPFRFVISNTAVVTSAVIDPVIDNNHNRADFTVTTRSNLTLTKSAPASVIAGLPLTYTITVTSTGPSTAYELLITDTLPPSVTVANVSSDCTNNVARTQVFCTLPDLPVGISHTLSFMADTDSDIAPNTALTNRVWANAINAVQQVSTTATTQSTVSATLRLTKTATSAVTAGQPLTYTITVFNEGPSNSYYLRLSDALPTGQISYTGQSTTAWPGVTCNYASGTVACIDSDGLSRGTGGTISIYATTHQTLPAGTLINNTAGVTATAAPTQVTSQATTNISDTVSHLAASKSADATVVAGSSVHYTVVVTNSGPSYAPVVNVIDQLPNGVTFAAGTPSAGCHSIGGNDIACQITALYVGAAQSQMITVTGDVSYLTASGTILTNTAEISASNAAAGVNVTATTAVRASSALTITKSATENVTTVTDPAATGEVITYTIVVTNSGPSLARGVVLTDLLPANVNYLAQLNANPPATPNVTGQTITWSLADMAPNAASVVVFTGRVITTTAGPVTLTNRAIISATTAPVSATATADTFVIPRARLAISKTLVSPQPVIDKATVVYTISVQNLGPSAVTAVTVTDVLEGGFKDGANDIRWSGATCTRPNKSLTSTCTLTPALAAGASRVITLSADADSNLSDSPTFTNTVYATATIATAVVSDTAIGATAPPRATLRVTKTLSPLNAPVVAGLPITYSVTVGNEGPSNASSVSLTDTLPAELLTPTVSVASPATCSGPVGQIVTCDLKKIDDGTAKTVTISGWLSQALPEGLVITNTAAATATIATAVASDQLTSTVRWQANLRVSKLAPQIALAGAPLQYTIIVTNDGPSVASAPTITDQLPITLSYLSALGSTPPIPDPAQSDQLLTWTVSGSLAPSATQIITFNTFITDAVESPETLFNTAYATAPEATSVASDTAQTQLQLQGNLVLTKTVLTSNPVAGGFITYGISVTNRGPSRAPSVIMTDVLPSQVTLNSWSAGCGPVVNAVITCTRSSSLRVNRTWEITLVGQINSSVVGAIYNTAYATATVATALANDTVTTTPGIQVGLQVTKTALPAGSSLIAGEWITYNIVAGNRGPSDASTAIITDRLPAELIFGSASPGYDLNAGVITFTLSNLHSGEQRPITITGQINAATQLNTVVTNTAFLSSPLTPTIASSQVTRTITARASLSVTKLAPATAPAGTPFSYTLIITNNGPSIAPSVQVTDRLPVSLTFLSQAGAVPAISGFISNGQLLTWTLAANMAPAATQLITFNVQVTDNVNSLVSITNTAYASATIATSVATGNAVTQLRPRADLALTKTVLTPNPIAGSDITYAITVTNLGPSPIPAVTITDDWPAVISYTSATSGCNAPFNAVITCTGGSLTQGASWAITLTGRITSSALSTFTNTAYATSAIATAQVSSTITTTPGIQVSLQVTKTAPPTVLAGDLLTYTIYVTNTGPSRAPIITLTDQLPVSVTLMVLPSGCVGSTVITCTLANVDVGPTNARSIELTPAVDSRVMPGTALVNTVVVTSSYAQQAVTATVTTTAQVAAMLRAAKQADATVLAGNPLTYTIIVTNDGPSLAPGLVVTDELPPGVNFSSASAGCLPNGNVISCPPFALDRFVQRLITITGQVASSVPAGSVITNTAYVSPTFNATRFSRFVTTTVNTAANLSINTSITPTSVVSTASSAVRVTIVFTNSGPSNAHSVLITGTLDALTYTTPIARPAYVGDPTGNCNSGSVPHQCTWSFTTVLTAALTGTIEFTATTPVTTLATSLSAQITSLATSDSNLDDNTNGTSLYYAQALARIYWAGVLPTRWPLTLISAPPRNFWLSSP